MSNQVYSNKVTQIPYPTNNPPAGTPYPFQVNNTNDSSGINDTTASISTAGGLSVAQTAQINNLYCNSIFFYGSPTTLNYYEEIVFGQLWGGAFSPFISFPMTFVRVGSMVTMTVSGFPEQIQGGGNSPSFSLNQIPTEFLNPVSISTLEYCGFSVIENGVQSQGNCAIDLVNGFVQIRPYASAGFLGGSNSGCWLSFTVSWNLL